MPKLNEVVTAILSALSSAQHQSNQVSSQFAKSYKYDETMKYFALPWKAGDDSADRLAAELDEPWNGYPGCGGKAGAK